MPDMLFKFSLVVFDVKEKEKEQTADGRWLG
jgi:hypothetical protein